MITPETFQPEWIEHLGKRHKNIDPSIAEKMILALTLVERLAQEPIPFVFKGGTCLVLLLKKARRFSVDVDIVTEMSPEELEAVLNRIAEHPPFLRVEYDEKRSTKKDGVPRGHYYLYFTPILNQKRSAGYSEPRVALDVLYEVHGYPELRDVPVTSEFLLSDGPPQMVKVPSVESITGDKLTAFAPRTTGILYGKRKEQEIIKQLFDVGVLFDEVQNVEAAAKSFAATVAKELAYRQLPHSPAEVLQDTIQAALLLSQHKINSAKTPDPDGAKELATGIVRFANFLIGTRFNIDIAVVAAAKTAYLAARLVVEDYAALPIYKDQAVADLRITDPQFNFLNKLRSMPEAMFFWQQTVQLLTEHKQLAVLTPSTGASKSVETSKTSTEMSTTINIVTQPDQHLLIARWSGPGIEEDFTHDDRAMLSTAQKTNCWRWLADFRVHGDTTAYNANDFFRTVLPDAKAAERFATGIILRVAVLIRPDFVVLSAGVPDADFQKRRGYTAKTFTDEGEAMQWLIAE
ncbi:nucleotidyl transferase AbiEii/AbiGii toxin family protein [Hymenobacter cellulosilyticus]|uniref:Nucleotidyl transferase AbiEii/AbiGii toxin family protein n=1 Tax=Hymenobacter cellulosilyticus TaxID=2932248 RepID=A0A8T9QC53_9BACT|nr:nucleotidyl transferase AbiEii/AbiGii toxin family protein [Hymenobacter cellulosilyticus]UOQ75097.1 nucleotidyl transferase AbiEii/AbiGii toxin family protein [Hymenobacter cellulosilyticus]